MLSLFEQILQFKELDLQMQLPTFGERRSGGLDRIKLIGVHSHKFLNRVVQLSGKQRRLFVRIISGSIRNLHRVLGGERIGRDETRVQPTYIQTKPGTPGVSSSVV